MFAADTFVTLCHRVFCIDELTITVSNRVYRDERTSPKVMKTSHNMPGVFFETTRTPKIWPLHRVDTSPLAASISIYCWSSIVLFCVLVEKSTDRRWVR